MKHRRRPSRWRIAARFVAWCVGGGVLLVAGFTSWDWLISNGRTASSIVTVFLAGGAVGGAIAQVTHEPLKKAYAQLAYQVDAWRLGDLRTDLDIVPAVSGEVPAVVDMGHAAAALEALALRLYRGDGPGSPRVDVIDAWVNTLTTPEAAAFNAILGESFGHGPRWDSDHPISVALARERAR